MQTEQSMAFFPVKVNQLQEQLILCIIIQVYHRFPESKALVTLIDGALTIGGLVDHRVTHQAPNQWGSVPGVCLRPPVLTWWGANDPTTHMQCSTLHPEDFLPSHNINTYTLSHITHANTPSHISAYDNLTVSPWAPLNKVILSMLCVCVCGGLDRPPSCGP